MERWIGLIRDDGKVEYNARFVLGNDAEQLEAGKLYTVEELEKYASGFKILDSNKKTHRIKKPLFIQTCAQNPVSKDYKRKWRCEKL